MIKSQEEEICRVHQGDEQLRRDQQLHHEQLLKQNLDLCEAHDKIYNEMKELNLFQGSTFDWFQEINWSKIDTLSRNSSKIQELQKNF